MIEFKYPEDMTRGVIKTVYFTIWKGEIVEVQIKDIGLVVTTADLDEFVIEPGRVFATKQALVDDSG